MSGARFVFKIKAQNLWVATNAEDLDRTSGYNLTRNLNNTFNFDSYCLLTVETYDIHKYINYSSSNTIKMKVTEL